MTLQFSLSLAQEDVLLDGKPYTLRELSGKGREAYADLQLAATTDDELTTLDGLTCGLVALSLVDGDGKPVPRETVDAWPGRVVEALAARARELSGLRGGAEGNGPEASGEVGSVSP